MASEHYDELLWDYVYGLLDQAQAEEVRAHVEACVDCMSALAQAEAHKQLLSRAARVVVSVPAFSAPGFSAPGQDIAPAPSAREEAEPKDAPGAAPTLPMAAGKPARWPWRRYWPAWAAAAALIGA